MVGPRGTPGAFTRGASRVRPGSVPGPPGVCLRGYVRVRPGRSRAVPGRACRGPLRARVPAASRTTMRVPATYDRAGPRPRTTVRGRAAYDRVGPAGLRPGRPPTGTDRTRFGLRTSRTGLGPDPDRAGPGQDRAGQDRAGRGRTDRAAPRTTERPRPGERPAYDRGGPPPCMTCAGSARVRPRGSAPVHDPRGVRTAHDRAGFGPRTTERVGPGGRPVRGGPCATCAEFGPRTTVPGSDCARPVRGSDGAPPCGARAVCDLGGFRPDTTAPGFGPCTTARVRPVRDREGPPPRRPCGAGPRRPCGAGPRTTVRGVGRVRPGRVSPVFDRVGPAPRTTPCGASTTYDLRDR